MTCPKCGSHMEIDLNLDRMTCSWLRPWRCMICGKYIYPGVLADTRTNGANHTLRYTGKRRVHGKTGVRDKHNHGNKRLLAELKGEI